MGWDGGGFGGGLWDGFSGLKLVDWAVGIEFVLWPDVGEELFQGA